MKVIVLSPYPTAVARTLRAAHEQVFTMNDRIDIEMLRRLGVNWIVSYGYQHLIRKPVLSLWPGRVINLHISLLPHNRGSDPNFWSWFDGAPKGVTIHQMDEGVDTGPILAQREVAFVGSETLATSYWRLRAELEDLFDASWTAIRDGVLKSMPQPPGGTYHRQADKTGHFAALPLGYDTSARTIEELGAARRRTAASAAPDGGEKIGDG